MATEDLVYGTVLVLTSAVLVGTLWHARRMRVREMELLRKVMEDATKRQQQKARDLWGRP